MDTNCMMDLLIADADELESFKMIMENTPLRDDDDQTYELKWTRGKASVFDTFFNQISEKNRAALSGEPRSLASARYRTALWTSMSKLGMNAHVPQTYDDLVFNNMIDTDGYSVSLHYVHPSLYGQTMYNGGAAALLKEKNSKKKQKREEKASGGEFPMITDLSETQRTEILNSDGKKAAGDPGKDCLLKVGGIVKNESVSYSAVQRRFESSMKRNTRELHRLLKKKASDTETYATLQESIGKRTDPETGEVTKFTSRSCNLLRFSAYLRNRREVCGRLKDLYKATGFRRRRYRVYLGVRSSEDKFIARLEKHIGPGGCILYGNWGRKPNMRHQAPTPGIGLRRKIHKRILTLTVYEGGTSQTYPLSQTPGEAAAIGKPIHPRSRTTKDKNGETHTRPIHHLLRFQDARCSSQWWNRDVVGYLNIRKNGLHALRYGTWHPCFRVRADADG
jgi:hypothetical protein